MARFRLRARILWMTSGFLLWAAQFTIIYGVTAVACARGYFRSSILGLGIVPVTITATTVLALGATGFVLWRRLADHSPVDRFWNAMTVWTSALALAAIAWNGLPVLIVPICAA